MNNPLIQEVRIHSEPKPLISTVYSYAAQYFHILVMASFVPFLVYFMLSWRDHISRTFQRLFQGESRYVVGKSWSGIGESTRGYVVGQFSVMGFCQQRKRHRVLSACKCRTGRWWARLARFSVWCLMWASAFD